MTVEQLLNALRAFGYEILYDPETHPDGPTEDDIPDLLGRLASLLDFEATRRVRPATESMSEFQAGYMAAIDSQEDFFQALIVRTAITSLLPDTEQLREVDGVTEFRDALRVAGGSFSMALRGHQEP